MAVNSDKPHRWKDDIAQSVDYYNDWFMKFAPKAFRDTCAKTTEQVEQALRHTLNLTSIAPSVLRQHPSVLPMLRMATAPPIARDRLIGLGYVLRVLHKIIFSCKLTDVWWIQEGGLCGTMS